MRSRLICYSLLLASLPLPLLAQKTSPSPPMGWNSWDAYGLTITEAQFRDNVTVMKEKLLPFGWRYAVIDEGWFFENPEVRKDEAKLVIQLARMSGAGAARLPVGPCLRSETWAHRAPRMDNALIAGLQNDRVAPRYQVRIYGVH